MSLKVTSNINIPGIPPTWSYNCRLSCKAILYPTGRRLLGRCAEFYTVGQCVTSGRLGGVYKGDTLPGMLLPNLFIYQARQSLAW